MLFSWYSRGADTVQTVTMGFLIYNVIAFGTQPLIGYLSDAYRKMPVEIIGFPLLILGLLFIAVPAVSIPLIGFGNAFFHIAGGIDSLRHSDGKMAGSGVFVSSGALGVAFGSLAGKSGSVPVYYPISILSLCLVWMCYIYLKRVRGKDTEAAFSIVKPELKLETIILLASVSILIRSYAGSVIPLGWRTTTLYFIFPAVGAFTGKALGGFVADKAGARNVAIYSLLAAVFLVTLGYTSPWVYLIGIGFFNMSMSVTLCAIASVLPSNPGLAFGITTLALLCGNVPTFFTTVAPAPYVFAMLTVVSMACLYYILRGKVMKIEENSTKYEENGTQNG